MREIPPTMKNPAVKAWCPPCNGNCRQGRDCPGSDPKSFEEAGPSGSAPARQRPPSASWIFVAVMAALTLMAAASTVILLMRGVS